MRTLFYLLVGLSTCCLSGFAQDQESKPQLSGKMQRFAWMIGEWRSLETFQEPNAQKTEGMIRCRPVLKGQWLQLEYSGLAGKKYQEIDLFGYDQATDKLVFHTFDNTGGRVYTQTYPAPKQFTVESSKDKKNRFAITFYQDDKDHFHLQFSDMNAAGGKGDWVMRAFYTRKGHSPISHYLCRECKLETLGPPDKKTPCKECGGPTKLHPFIW